MIRPTALSLLLLSLAIPTLATTRHVPSQYATIQAALDLSSSGDTVLVACGTYNEIDLTHGGSVVIKGGSSDPNCTVIDQEGSEGFFHGGGTLTLINLTIRDGYYGLKSSASVVATNCVLMWTGGADGAIQITDTATFTDCVLDGNSGQATAIAIGTAIFTRCRLVGNQSGNGNCALSASAGTFIDCVFDSNYGALEAAICCTVGEFRGCTFSNNTFGSDPGYDYFGGALHGATLTVVRCTFYGNYAGVDTHKASAIGVSGHAEIERCIFVGNSGPEIVACRYVNTTVEISCSNIWGNPDSNWDGCLAGQLGINGNISVDPKFCNPAGNDFHLSSISPCLNTDCGTMGPFGLGCYDGKPGISSIIDVGNDQGRQVRLTWYRSLYDAPGNAVNGYAVYRRKDQFVAASLADRTEPLTPEAAALLGWDYIATVPRRFDDEYQFIAPTLCDSTITSGQCWSAFFISAMTPTVFYDSPIDSGYSKDNLPPPPPTNFAVNYNTGSGNHLIWNAVAANDFAGFRIYRGTSPSFVPSSGSLVQTTTQTTWNDGAYDGWNVFYKVRAFDVAGNESVSATASTVTGANTPTRRALSLGPNTPNPFNPSTRIPFVLPTNGRVRVSIYDVSGALVRVLVDETMRAGSYEAEWNGRDGTGREVSSGVYLCRLEQAGRVLTMKVVAIK